MPVNEQAVIKAAMKQRGRLFLTYLEVQVAHDMGLALILY